MTIEQYGFGIYGIRIARDDFVGTYRFRTLEEAQEFKAKNGGFHFREDSEEDGENLPTLTELGMAAAVGHRSI
jgi:hypothetical protein